MGVALIVSFLLLLVFGVPIALSIGVSAMLVMVLSDMPLEALPQTLFSGVNSFSLVAVPFFVMAGDILARGGISDRIVVFAEAAMGRIRGGLSIVSIVASMFVAAISGSGAATTAAVGSALLPQLKRKGYDLDFSAALIASAGTIGVVIPPSVPMVLYAVIVGVPVSKLFMAGFTPGFLMGGILVVYALYVAKKRNYPASDPVDSKEKRKRFIDALWGLMTPVLILGGIFSGYFTPSEAAAVAVAYSLFVAVFVYKALNLKTAYRLIVNSGVTSALIMFIISTSKIFGWQLAFYEIPDKIASAVLQMTGGAPFMVYLVITLIILVAGMFMETASALIILTPIFLPAIAGVGGNLIHFGIIIVVGLAIGMATPPVAIDIYVASAITGLTIEEVSRPILPMVVALILVLFAVTYAPWLSLALPRLVYGSL
ncbi:MAG: TRAP transporter large permease [Synergistaceae bacterium]|jgi:C4-dicarboxylate transporter DctM subunit|nr:TRAP transporter large permease [Synergistaceae bacterium]